MKTKLILASLLAGAMATSAGATTIISAVGATASNTTFGTDILDTINQNGLSGGYTSGVTDFDTYIGTDPTHTSIFSGNEWFTDLGVTEAVVTYDLGSVQSIDALALWNEESSGFGTAELLASTDGIVFSALSSITPIASTSVVDYSAQVFGFAETALRYLRFDISDCPNGAGTYNGCAIGEVAFRVGDGISPVPVPASLPLLLAGMGGLAMIKRRRKAA